MDGRKRLPGVQRDSRRRTRQKLRITNGIPVPADETTKNDARNEQNQTQDRKWLVNHKEKLNCDLPNLSSDSSITKEYHNCLFYLVLAAYGKKKAQGGGRQDKRR